MTRAAARPRRLAERIHVIVAELMERRVKDPRLGFVTVTDVRVTGDCREATIFYTVLGDQAQYRESAAALESATGMLRTEVGQLTGVKFAPSLRFVPDHVPSEARHIDELLGQAREAGRQIHELAARAQYAGESMPYRERPGGDQTPDLPADDGGHRS